MFNNESIVTIYVKNEVYRKELFYIWCRMKNYVKFINNKVKICKEWEDFDTFYPILGRIPPLLSEAKVGDECRLFFFTETIDNQ